MDGRGDLWPRDQKNGRMALDGDSFLPLSSYDLVGRGWLAQCPVGSLPRT